MRVHFKNEFISMALIAGLFLALVSLDIRGADALLGVLRIALSLVYILFIPGYALQAALFPYKDQFDAIERFAITIGLSFAIIPPLAFLLDRLPWGLELWPILIAEACFAALFAALALYRRRHIPETEQYQLSLDLHITRGWLQEENRGIRILAYVLIAAFVVIMLTSVALLTLQQPGEQFTEFYVLGAENMAQDYPRVVQLDQDVAVTVGITNREGRQTTYHLTIYNDGTLIADGPDITLEDDETIETPVSFSPVETGENVPIEFRLFRDDDSSPCCTLRLWLNVRPARSAP